jgi:hypothetical protein
MDEEAEREASAYVQRAMSFSGLGRRLTVVAPPASARVEEPAATAAVANEARETVRTVALPAIPVGLPEGATLAPMSGSREIVVPVAAPIPAVVGGPTPPMASTRDLDQPRVVDPPRRTRADSSVPIVLGLSVLVMRALLTRRRRRRISRS